MTNEERLLSVMETLDQRAYNGMNRGLCLVGLTWEWIVLHEDENLQYATLTRSSCDFQSWSWCPSCRVAQYFGVDYKRVHQIFRMAAIREYAWDFDAALAMAAQRLGVQQQEAVAA